MLWQARGWRVQVGRQLPPVRQLSPPRIRAAHWSPVKLIAGHSDIRQSSPGTHTVRTQSNAQLSINKAIATINLHQEIKIEKWHQDVLQPTPGPQAGAASHGLSWLRLASCSPCARYSFSSVFQHKGLKCGWRSFNEMKVPLSLCQLLQKFSPERERCRIMDVKSFVMFYVCITYAFP